MQLLNVVPRREQCWRLTFVQAQAIEPSKGQQQTERSCSSSSSSKGTCYGRWQLQTAALALQKKKLLRQPFSYASSNIRHGFFPVAVARIQFFFHFIFFALHTHVLSFFFIFFFFLQKLHKLGGDGVSFNVSQFSVSFFFSFFCFFQQKKKRKVCNKHVFGGGTACLSIWV